MEKPREPIGGVIKVPPKLHAELDVYLPDRRVKAKAQIISTKGGVLMTIALGEEAGHILELVENEALDISINYTLPSTGAIGVVVDDDA